MAEVRGVFLLVFQADFMWNKFDGLAFEVGERRFFVLQEEGLIDIGQLVDFLAALNGFGNLHHSEFAHAVHPDVGLGVDQDAGFQTVRPVVVVRHATQRSFDAANDDGYIGVELFQNVAIDHWSIVGTEARLAAWSVGIVAAQALVGGVVVHHRVHAARRHAKINSRLTELLEVTQVVAPVGLRDKRHTKAVVLQDPSDDRRPKRGMVDVGVARDEHDVHLVPTAQVGLFLRYREPVKEGHSS